MLGLADRGRIFDLVETLLAGTVGQALELFAQLHRDGAEPLQILGDLAEAVHAATRAKVLGVEAAGEGLSSEERRRAADLGGRLSMPILARAWQVLLKGLAEAADAPNPMTAAEMVLVRLAYTADLPPPDAVIRALGDGSAGTRPAPTPTAAPPVPGGPGGAAMQVPRPRSPSEDELDARFGPGGVQGGFGRGTANGSVGNVVTTDSAADTDADNADADGDAELDLGGAVPALPAPRSFAELVDLVGAHREAKLKVHLEEHVSLVKFDPAGSVELHLLPGAPKELGNELRTKLNAWTGKRWVVALSSTPGERPLGEALREWAKSHPAVAAVLRQFPGAKFELKPLQGTRPDDTGTG
jgi:DNA polymerase-3 subunit gamma/tau